MLLDQDIPNGLTTLSHAAANLLFDDAKRLMFSVVDYQKLMMMYTCAMKAVRIKFDILNTEFKARNRRITGFFQFFKSSKYFQQHLTKSAIYVIFLRNFRCC